VYVLALGTCRSRLVTFVYLGRRRKTDTLTLTWLLSAPQFWYGFVACAALVILALLPTALFPRRTVLVHSTPVRAPVPLSDPFYKPGPYKRLPTRARTALREHREKLEETRPPFDARRSSRLAHINEARKQAIWHPHPDDAVPYWNLW
jgi:hypothetical protein